MGFKLVLKLYFCSDWSEYWGKRRVPSFCLMSPASPLEGLLTLSPFGLWTISLLLGFSLPYRDETRLMRTLAGGIYCTGRLFVGGDPLLVGELGLRRCMAVQFLGGTVCVGATEL